MSVQRKKLIRSATADRGPPETGGHVNDGIHTVEQIGPNMSKLPNGNLLCLNVPIARVGWMIYGPGETPIEVGSEGVAYVERTAETLFDPVCVGSFMGAAIVDEHPDVDVTPDNWKALSRGFATTNVRRGTDQDIDVLLADLIVTDKELIESILAGKREVSCGYSADYTQTADGVGTQTSIIGNHIALVKKGRCGPRCAIGDQDYQPERKEPQMATTKRVKIASQPQRRVALDAARKRVADAENELAALEGGEGGEGEEGEGGDTHIHLHVDTGNAHSNSPMTGVEDGDLEDGEEGEGKKKPPIVQDDDTEARFAALEQSVQALGDQVKQLVAAMAKSGGTGDGDPDDNEEQASADAKADEDTSDEFPDDLKGKAAKTADSKALETGYKKLMTQAEVLVPGFRMPTFDAAATRAKTVDQMCGARRQALGACCATHDGAALVSSVNGGKAPDLAKMDCKQLAGLFQAAAGAKGLLNNVAATRDSKATGDNSAAKAPVVQSITALNEQNRKFWEGQLRH